MKHILTMLGLVLSLYAAGCATATRPADDPLPPPRAEDGLCLVTLKRPGFLARVGNDGFAELVGVDRKSIGSYELKGDDTRSLPAGKREIVFRWNRGRDYAQATADWVLPRDSRLVLQFERKGNYVYFWLEDASNGKAVGSKTTGAITFGRYIPLPIFVR